MSVPPRTDAARHPRDAWEQGLPPDNAPPAPMRRDRGPGLALAIAVVALVIVALIVLL